MSLLPLPRPKVGVLVVVSVVGGVGEAEGEKPAACRCAGRNKGVVRLPNLVRLEVFLIAVVELVLEEGRILI